MDLAEIRKKARQQAEKATSPEAARRPVLPGAGQTAEPTETESCWPVLTSDDKGPNLLQQFASEEEYLQGLAGGHLEPEQEVARWLSFLLGDEEYALDLEVVEEVIKSRSCTELPHVPGYVRGILSLRGVVVPVIDLCRKLALGEVQPSEQQRIIICQDEEQPVGLLVDRITQVVRIPRSAIEATPVTLNNLEEDFVAGVGRFQQRMLILLNPEQVLKVY